MARRYWPTVGQAHQYLVDLGFTFRKHERGFVIYQHPDDDSWFAIPDRSPTDPAREADLIDMRAQLTGRGFVSDEEFAEFWDQRAPRVLPPPQPAPSA